MYPKPPNPATVLIDPKGPIVSVPAVPYISTRRSPVAPSNKTFPVRIWPGAKPSQLSSPLRCALTNFVPPSTLTCEPNSERVRSPLTVTPVNRLPLKFPIARV